MILIRIYDFKHQTPVGFTTRAWAHRAHRDAQLLNVELLVEAMEGGFRDAIGGRPTLRSMGHGRAKVQDAAEAW